MKDISRTDKGTGRERKLTLMAHTSPENSRMGSLKEWESTLGKMEIGMRDTGKMGSFMAKELRFLLMGLNTMEIGWKASLMGMGFAHIPSNQGNLKTWEKSILATGKMDSLMDKAKSTSQMDQLMKENGMKEKLKEKESKDFQMEMWWKALGLEGKFDMELSKSSLKESFMKVSFITTSLMEKGSKYGQMEGNTKESGLMVSLSDKESSIIQMDQK